MTTVFLSSILALAAPLSFGNSLYLDAKPFSKCWTYSGVPDLAMSVVTDASGVYFVDTDSQLHAVDPALGKKMWSAELGGDIISNLLVVNDSILVATRTSSPGSTASAARLHSISKQTGVTNSTSSLNGSLSVSLGVANGRLVVLGDDGHVTEFSADSSTQSFQKGLAAQLSTRPIFGADSAFFGTASKEIVRLSRDRSLTTLAKLEHIPTALLVDDNGDVLAGDERGNLILFSSDGGTRWKFRNGARISHIVAHDSEFIVASHDNFIYKLTRDGAVSWKRRLPGRIFHRLVVSGDVVVGSVIGEGGVYVIDATSGKVLNRIDVGDGNSVSVAAATQPATFVLAGVEGIALYSGETCSVK